MPEVPPLITLCIRAIRDAILDEDGNLPYVYELPSDLFDRLLSNLPPMALQILQDAMPSVSSSNSLFSDDCLTPSRKRKRVEKFDTTWKAMYKSRWPTDQQDESAANWQQIYWEKHLQSCLDAATETDPITLCDGVLGELEIPDALLKYVSCEGHISGSKSYSKLAYHCERFGRHARCLRLQSVHCVADIGYLLRNSKLEHLEIHWLKSKEQVEGLCKLLEQNKETLASIEFVHCKLPVDLVTAICDSLHVKGNETNVIKSFSIKRSSFLDCSHFPLPLGLESLLKATRSGLTSLILSDNRMGWKTAKLVFDTLLEAESCLQVIDLSENNIAGWLSHIKWGSPSCISTEGQISKSLKSLRLLNLRCNNLEKDDVDCLKYAMVYMPNLEVLNLSENPLLDDGLRILFPYLVEKSKSGTPLVELHLESCELSCRGASQLLKVLSALDVPLKSLFIGENHLSSKFGPSLGRFLHSGIQTLDVKGIGLGLAGFADAQKEISQDLSIVRINLSGNAGGARIADFLSTAISHAPKLTSVDASSNWIPVESVSAICSFLKAGKGKLEHINLRQNPLCNKEDIVSVLAEFQVNGKPNISLSSPVTSLYDNDP